MSTPSELGYLAGIIDGEGHIRVAPRQIEIHIAMADTVILEWCLDHFGGWLGDYEQVRPNAARSVRVWKLSRKRGLERVLREVLPYLVLKYGEAQIALEAIEHRRNGPVNQYVPGFEGWKAKDEAICARAHETLLARK